MPEESAITQSDAALSAMSAGVLQPPSVKEIYLAHVHTKLPDRWIASRSVTCQQHNGVIFSYRNKPQAENIAVTTGIALQNSLAQRTVFVQLNLSALGLHLQPQCPSVGQRTSTWSNETPHMRRIRACYAYGSALFSRGHCRMPSIFPYQMDNDA